VKCVTNTDRIRNDIFCVFFLLSVNLEAPFKLSLHKPQNLNDHDEPRLYWLTVNTEVKYWLYYVNHGLWMDSTTWERKKVPKVLEGFESKHSFNGNQKSLTNNMVWAGDKSPNLKHTQTWKTNHKISTKTQLLVFWNRISTINTMLKKNKTKQKPFLKMINKNLPTN
jgi:hypothetical protein